MTMKVRLGGAWKDITGGKVFLSGSWRTLVAIKTYKDGAWRDVANFTAPVSGMTVTTSPAESFFRGGRTTAVSQNITATPSGGLAPYTYAWEVVSQVGSSGTVTIPLPTSATTTVRCTFTEIGDVNCVIRVTVTDSLGSSASADIDGNFSKLEPIGTGGLA